jgi:hypothetical protein
VKRDTTSLYTLLLVIVGTFVNVFIALALMMKDLPD